MDISKVNIHKSDVLDWLKSQPDNSFDAMLTDPPAGISFMGKRWDGDKGGRGPWVAWMTDVMSEALRVLRPGAYALVWSFPQTSHWTAWALESAGFEIRNCVYHLVGNRMPKNWNVSKGIDKKLGGVRVKKGTKKLGGNAAVSLKDKVGTYGVQVGSAEAIYVDVTTGGTKEARAFDGTGTCLRSLCEPWWLVRKPLEGNLVETALKYGTGVLNVEGCRIGVEGGTSATVTVGEDSGCSYGSGLSINKKSKPIDAGRWPGNLILAEDVAEDLDAAMGDRAATLTGRADPTKRHENPGNNHGASSFGGGNSACYADDGGPSRYYFTTKVSTWEREFGCEELPLIAKGQIVGRDEDSVGINDGRAGAVRTGARHNPHPTLKPIALTEYLAKLLLPPHRGNDRRILVPFAGVGSEMIGAMRAKWEVVEGVEGDFDDMGHCDIARARIKRWSEAHSGLTPGEIMKASGEKEDEMQVTIFERINDANDT